MHLQLRKRLHPFCNAKDLACVTRPLLLLLYLYLIGLAHHVHFRSILANKNSLAISVCVNLSVSSNERIAVMATEETLKWKVGLINSAGKYLTAEQFASKVSTTGTSLRKKQTWVLESTGENDVALKSTYGKYLSFYRNDTADAASESIGNEQKFELITQDDGRVAIKSVAHGRYLAEIGGELSGMKDLGPTNLFTLQLALHPQINLRNSNRKTYCHLENDELHCNEDIPWGYDAMIVLDFQEGRYALQAANGMYLERTGDLVKDISDNTLYVLVFRSAQVAFRDCQGKYLTAIGPHAKVQSRKNTISKDELFTLEDSHAQMSFKAANSKYVSIQGEEVRANQLSVTDSEIFQLEAVDRSDHSGNVQWAVRSKSMKYWSCSGVGSGIVGNKDTPSDASTHFSVEWLGRYVALKASNGKYITVKETGRWWQPPVKLETKTNLPSNSRIGRCSL